MRTSVVFFLCMVIALAFAQNAPAGFQDLIIIDDFVTVTSNIIIQTTSDSVFPITRFAFTSNQTGGILGVERDVQLVFQSGVPNLVLSTGVANGNFQSSTPNQGTGRSACQYDGVDGTFDLNPSGLGSVDFTANGATSIRGRVQSDLASTVTFNIYSGSTGARCQNIIPVAGGNDSQDFIIPFGSFTPGCTFSNVGAVEIVIDEPENVDIFISVFSVYGPIPSATPSSTPGPSPSNTPTPGPSQSNSPSAAPSQSPAPSPSNTPSAAPSQSNTPTSAPSQSRTPAPSPSNTPAPSPSNTPSRTPSPSRQCICQCPAFTCEVFRVNNRYNYYNGFYDAPLTGLKNLFNL